jgi:integrase
MNTTQTKPKPNSFDFAEHNLLALPAGSWWDSTTPGLGVCVHKAGAVFFIHDAGDGRPYAFIGAVATTALATARAYTPPAPREPKPWPTVEAPAGSKEVTLREVLEAYKHARQLKPATVRHYNSRLKSHCSDWLDIPITAITGDMVEERHKAIAGPAVANSTMRTLRALMRFAQYKYRGADGSPVVSSNPVTQLSETRAWNKDRRRTRVVRAQQLQAFVSAVLRLKSETSRDLILLLLFTGMRSVEARELRWEHVNLQCGVLELPSVLTKTGEPYTVPLSDYAWALLHRRRATTISDYVFPGVTPQAPISNVTKACTYVRQRSGVAFSLHDLRRSFVTFADELEVKHQIIKALINHKNADETEMYIQPSVERLRRASQQVTNYILQQAGIRSAAQ